jgi:hypothetical protein
MVRNSGDYASGWWWYYGLTGSEVGSRLSANNARLISASAYNTSGGIRFAVVMVSNTGANQKGWWWYYGVSGPQISGFLSSNNARLINLTPYPGGGFLAIMVNNTGTNATGWWWYYGVNSTQINNALATNHARLVDLSRNGDGTWNVVMYSNPNTRWYWYFNMTPGGAVDRANQLGERIIDTTSYFIGGTKYQAVLMTDNLNALSDKLFAIIAPRVDSGIYGFYLKRVGNSTTLAGLQQTKQYEPASALKVLYHAKSIHEEAIGNTSDATVIVYRYDPAAPTNPGICPDNFTDTSTTNLKDADIKMMQASDNRMTRGILTRYTKSSMLSYATALGLTSTQINHNIGCPTSTTYNRTTLVDLGRIYEAFQNGRVTANSSWIGQFRGRMLNQSNFGGFKNAICPIVNQEAAALGKTSSVATSFCNNMTWIAKGGSYQYGGSLPYRVSLDNVSLTGVPYRNSRGVISPQFFVFGEYVDQTQINSSAEETNLNNARGRLYTEALRPYIRAGLSTW